MGNRWAILVGSRVMKPVPIAYFEDRPIALSSAVLHDRIAIFCLVAMRAGGVFITHYLLHPQQPPHIDR
jgi:hypothetical protein